MVASSKTMDALKAIGLNKYERNLWVALLSRGVSSAGELSDISHVPRSRCYDVLESLAIRGFVMLQPGKPIKYVATQPREAFERVKSKIIENAKEMSDKIERLKNTETEKELEKLFKTKVNVSSIEQLTGAIRSKNSIIQQMETMIKGAKKSVNCVLTPALLTEFASRNSALKKASKSGVKIRIAAPFSSVDKEILLGLSSFAELRDIKEGKIKNIGRFLSIDGQEFIIGLADEDKVHHTQDIAMWTQSQHATISVIDPLFNVIWDNSVPIKA
ncbi:MAG: TrmB family transcriptional regulator [Candidatus Aenigmarchaeota archaeon]|nr:TrmB family transcriptional regulator [Candidatus Aenigmarchaeota archaeon]